MKLEQIQNPKYLLKINKEYYKVEYDEDLARIKISEIKEFNIDNDFFVHPFNSLEYVIKDLNDFIKKNVDSKQYNEIDKSIQNFER